LISHLASVASELPSDTVVHEFAVIRERVTVGAGVIIHPHVVIESDVVIGDNVEIFPGCYIGKEPKGAGALARKPEFQRGVRIGNNCSIGPGAVIFQDVMIGNETLIGDGASIREQCHVGSRCIISRYVTINYHTTIGDRTKIMDQTHITGNATIGNDVFVSLLVGTTNDNAAGRHGYQSESIKGPTIHDQAIVGAGATLLPGIVIENGGVVGAGSVVTKDVPQDTLVLGMPARAIRRLSNE
jgi:acetyltransferase-like isoleucine patch superfamily enzyme